MLDAYLDHAATTPMRPEAVAAMQPLLGEVFGNPSGSHGPARRARRLLDDARDAIAAALGAEPGDVVFTSGGTEANNLAIADAAARRGGASVRCSAVEHHAVLGPVEAVGGRTFPVGSDGRVDGAALAAELDADPGASTVALMVANNELGSLLAIDALPVGRGLAIHLDAVAAAPWIDLAPHVAQASTVAISGHKFGGPKGIGVLVDRGAERVLPMLRGGGQERERRAGTPNVAGAVAMAAALAATVRDRDETGARVEALRARLVGGLLDAVPDACIVSPTDPAHRTPGTVLVCFEGVDREALVFLLDQAGVAASWGSSCSSGATEPSHVLAALGVAPELAAGALRLSLGWTSTEADVDAALAAVPVAVAQLRRTPAVAR